MLYKTNLGLNIRAAGWKPVALTTQAWTCPDPHRAALMTGALAGLGGGYMAIVTAGIFVPFMTGGQGFIAIVIAMLGRGRPIWVLIGSLLFGIALSISTALQLVGINVPTDLIQMLPFIVVMSLLYCSRDARICRPRWHAVRARQGLSVDSPRKECTNEVR